MRCGPSCFSTRSLLVWTTPMLIAPFVEEDRPWEGAGGRLPGGLASTGVRRSYRPSSRGARAGPFGTAFAVSRPSTATFERGFTRESSHAAQDPGVLRLRLTVLLSSGVSATRSDPRQGRRGRVDAVRASARAPADPASRGRLPPEGLVAVGLPDGRADGRPDRPARGLAPAAHATAFEGYQYAREHGKGNDYNVRVLEAFFVEGRDIGDVGVLTKLAGEVGLDDPEVRGGLAVPEVPGGPPPGPPSCLRGGRGERRADVRHRRTRLDRLAGPGDAGSGDR